MNFHLSLNKPYRPIKIDIRSSAWRLVLLGLMCAALSACTSKEAKPAGQSLARVNDTEITVHQLNIELAQLASEPQATPRKEVLDGLIARELLVEQAKKNKLDRDPNVMQTIERARDQILAQAYLKTRMSQMPKPTQAEIETFYQNNPQLFAQRMQFGTRELSIATTDLSPELVKLMASAQSLDQVQQWLDTRQVPYVPTQAVRSSVELPADVVKALSGMSAGQLFTIRQGDRSQLIALQDIQKSPLTLAMVREKIEQYLTLQNSKKTVDEEVARLRSGAKIAYLKQADQLDEVKQQAANQDKDKDKGDQKKEPALSDLERGISDLK